MSEVAQSCPTLCDPMDHSLPGSSVLGTLKARALEWIAVSFSRSSHPRNQTWVSRITSRRLTIWASHVLHFLNQDGMSRCNLLDLAWIPHTHIYYKLCYCCCCCWVTSVVSDSVRPHTGQPTRLPCPWDSPGKNTGVGCHFLLQCMKVKSEKWKWSHSVVLDSKRPHGLQPTRLLLPWDLPGKSTGVGCHCLFQAHEWVYGQVVGSSVKYWFIAHKVVEHLLSLCFPIELIFYILVEESSMVILVCKDRYTHTNRYTHTHKDTITFISQTIQKSDRYFETLLRVHEFPYLNIY